MNKYAFAREFTDPKKCAEFPQTAAEHIKGLLKELERRDAKNGVKESQS